MSNCIITMPEDYFLMGCFLPSFFILAFSPFCFFFPLSLQPFKSSQSLEECCKLQQQGPPWSSGRKRNFGVFRLQPSKSSWWFICYVVLFLLNNIWKLKRMWWFMFWILRDIFTFYFGCFNTQNTPPHTHLTKQRASQVHHLHIQQVLHA